jgi:undecaprenyl-diphosphatase
MLFEQLKELLVAILLGAVQGFTEFLPISSTVHVGLASQFLGGDLGIYATNLISLGTTVALIEYFWNDIKHFFATLFKSPQWYQLALATIPIILASLFFSDKIDGVFRNIRYFGIFLIVGAILLGMAELYHKHKQTQSTNLTTFDYAVIGFFQSLAIFPGMSRSGSTLAGGLFIAKDRSTVVRASFWLSVPAFLLAGIYSIYKLIKTSNPPQFLNDVSTISNLSWISIIAGALTAYVVGIFSLRWLIQFLTKHNSFVFIGYRILLGIILILISFR